MNNILIVCTANICRSPMGEAILKKLVAAREDADQWHIESAGTWAIAGSAPAFLSKYVMELMGLDISTHRSQPVSLALLKNFDLILTMENEHKKWLTTQFREFAQRIFMLSEMVGVEEDIADPIGGELSDYAETAQLLDRLLTDGLERINQLAIEQQEL
jgi:protein-tyrosine phosphatase